LAFDPTRHHNNPPPALRIENLEYLAQLKQLSAELRNLNTLLEQNARPSETKRAGVDLASNAQKFLDSYIPLLGRGTAVLTVASLATVLYHLGVGRETIDQIMSLVRLAR
jgi:hypothetical protein